MFSSSIFISSPAPKKDIWPILNDSKIQSFVKDFEQILQLSDPIEKKKNFIVLVEIIALQNDPLKTSTPSKYWEPDAALAVGNLISTAIFSPEMENFLIENLNQEILLKIWQRLTQEKPPLQKISLYNLIKIRILDNNYKLGVDTNLCFSKPSRRHNLKDLLNLMCESKSWQGLLLQLAKNKAELENTYTTTLLKEQLQLIDTLANFYLTPGHAVRAYQLYQLVEKYPDELSQAQKHQYLLQSYKSILLAEKLSDYSQPEILYVGTATPLPNDPQYQNVTIAKNNLLAFYSKTEQKDFLTQVEHLAQVEFEQIIQFLPNIEKEEETLKTAICF